ncbi:2-oxo acid dehydrogenase subunit E2 [Kribbella sandramycini]|uniref:Dihydrolipoamide acetyltransferase component of pyruvate dehydrogenase complex n=1 Tax=Kribbella sandramycini TaxID=60450 RepID=A0A7Y4KZN0_9ACTN|nr:dihydrolipoamide acetyltransferase family protein [Kribbella sandramycini]MBB6565325.1 pyruvate dehydrogenase E2 component (dihydrolipoamide acetyltransferase) [Kribbella sandramycini]NOL41594.1 2-oxo acid dehydrogenase subunit E2 [Kribbella sandramycini]
MGIQQFRLPDVGEGLVEAEIVSWKVKPGDTVKLNDTVVEIETAKSLVELPVPFAGTVHELLVPEGETVDVGTPIIAVLTDAPDEPAAPAPKPAADEGRTAVLVGYGPRTTEAKRRPRKSGTPAEAPAGPRPAPASAPATSAAPAGLPAVAGGAAASASSPVAVSNVRVLAKPPVRKLAKDLGVDLGAVVASGPGGIVTRADVENHVSTPAAAVAAPTVVAGRGDTRVPVKGVQKVMAQAMVASAFTAPHVTEWITVDVSATMELVERLKADKAFRELKVSPLLIVAKAVTLAARRTPVINAAWDEQAQEIVYKGAVNLGIAAATPRGLIVPNIKNADQLTLPELCGALNGLVATAREGKTAPADQAGGSFTITNVGVFGVDAGTPIINPGEAAILAFGAVRKQPWVVNDEIVPRWITTLALSFDHRLIDGEKGSIFLADVASILEDPARALMF